MTIILTLNVRQHSTDTEVAFYHSVDAKEILM